MEGQVNIDRVPNDAAGSLEVGFNVPDRYNASEILFANLAAGRADKIAIYTATANISYGELCTQAARVGNALSSLGLKKGDRILLLLNDTPAYPAIFFGAVRAGFVPMLINTLSPPDLIQFYLQDSGARVAIIDNEYAAIFNTSTGSGTALHTLSLIHI